MMELPDPKNELRMYFVAEKVLTSEKTNAAAISGWRRNRDQNWVARARALATPRDARERPSSIRVVIPCCPSAFILARTLTDYLCNVASYALSASSISSCQ